jgi:glycosyltransferase involved in cell wall biosynthesis
MTHLRVLILNNYPMDRVIREVDLKETPDQVLFGVNRLQEYGFEPIFLPYPALGPWHKLQKLLSKLRIPLELGDLQQQVLALQLSSKADLVYAPCGSQTHLLQYLRALGLYKVPIVTLMHHSHLEGRLDFLRNWQRRLFISGADKLPCLSKALVNDLRGLGANPDKLASMEWGTDVEFYGPWEPPGSGVIATGRTGRDFVTFAKALGQSHCHGTVIGLQGQLDDPIFQKSSNLRIVEARNKQPVPGENQGWLKYPELCQYMRSHGAIAIPLFPQQNLAGLTSLMDALGLGRAVLMTRNRHIDIDIEAEGIGFWLDAGDVNAWVRCLNWVQDNPVEVHAMGKRARQMAEGKFRSHNFASQLAQLIGTIFQR